MIHYTSDDLGLSGKSIEVLKSWRKLKENPERFAVAYGATDIDTLNLLLEDYHYLQSNASKKDFTQDFQFSTISGIIFFLNALKDAQLKPLNMSINPLTRK